METERIEELLTDVINISIDAGNKIMEIYENEADFNIELKGDNSPLTIADKAANDIICEGLTKISPEIPIITEEHKALPYEDRKDWEYCWMVDPLDGTKEFIKRNGEFTVNVALIHNGRSVAGVVYAPALKELYWANKGNGAFIKDSEGVRKLDSNHFTKADAGLRFVCSRSHLNEATSDYMSNFKTPETVAKGSSLKFLIIANGNAEIYPRLAPTMEWDTAAAHIVLEEAGGSVVNSETGLALEYNKENLLNPHFLAFANEQES